MNYDPLENSLKFTAPGMIKSECCLTFCIETVHALKVEKRFSFTITPKRATSGRVHLCGLAPR